VTGNRTDRRRQPAPPGASHAPGAAPLLLVEDSEATAALMHAHLVHAGHQVAHAPSAGAAARALAALRPPLVLLDLNLPDDNGLSLLRRMRAESAEPGAPPMPAVIVVTGHGGVPETVEAMRLGAFDFLQKPVDPARLVYAVAAALEGARAHARLRHVAADSAEDAPVPGMLGRHETMRAAFRRLRRAAQSNAPVLITGETGTGKELAAQALHTLSPRAGRPFVALNCAAIPRELIESELFGHVRGAFTGAVADRAGAAGEAEGGSLFLDEIGELDPAVQAKLLRFLQSGAYRRLGAMAETRADVRFICATHRDLRAAVAAGRFREDLYFRLNVIPLALPPLRARGSDVVLLAESMLASMAAEEGAAFTRFSAEAAALLCAHPWPGNVRELANVLRRITVLEEGETISAAMLAPLLAETAGRGAPRDPPTPAIGHGALPGHAGSDIASLEATKRAAIQRALRLTGGNVREAADRLGIAASTIYRMGLAGKDDPAPSADATGASSPFETE
jgi:two-component system repressor protein LuxO